MVISDVSYSPYLLTLKTPFINSSSAIASREGYIITICDNKGNCGSGEAAPLPGAGSDDPGTALECIHSFIADCPEEINNLDDISSVAGNFTRSPSALFGCEQALLNLLSSSSGKSLYELFNEDYRDQVKVNIVLGFMKPREAADAAKEMILRGFDTIKIKAGRKSFQDDIEVIKSVRETAGPDVKLRIDVNGSWAYSEALKNISSLESYNPEYIEQPVASKDDLIKLAAVSRVPVAADESVRSMSDANEFIREKYCPVLILKPMMLGSILETVNLIRSAAENNIKIIISSSFESSVGFRALLFLASIIKNIYSHGLSTLDYFTSDLRENPFGIEEGIIKISNPLRLSEI